MTKTTGNLRFKMFSGALTAAFAAVGCSAYPGEVPTVPTQTTKSIEVAPPTGPQAASRPALSEMPDGYSYSAGAPVFDEAGTEAVPYWTVEYPAGCAKYRVFNRSVQFQSCDEDLLQVWVPDPVPTPRKTPTPKPTATPKPSPSPQLPSGARPSVKPRGQDVFWFRVTAYFSPNGDSVKDTARVDVVATPDVGAWELSVEGQNIVVASGVGAKLNHTWDGKRNGTALPDGAYTLVLKAQGRVPVRAISMVDTTAPEFTLVMDGVENPEVVNNQLPVVEAKLRDTLSGIDHEAPYTNFAFSVRQDGVTPKVYEDKIIYDEATEIIKYKVPPEEDALLYGGDQHVRLTLKDRAGNQAERKGLFAVGGHSLWAFNFDVRLAYRTEGKFGRVLQATEASSNPRLQPYANPNYKIIMLDADRVYAQELSPEQSRPISEPGQPPRVFPNPRTLNFFGLFLIVNAISGDTAKYVEGDREENSIKDLIKKGRTFRVDVGDIGDHAIGTIDVNDKTYKHIEKDGPHVEAGPTTLARALWYLKNREQHPAEIELWNKPTSSKSVDDALVMKYRGELWWLPIQKNDTGTGGAQRVVTAYSPLRGYGGRGAVSFAPLEHQWMYITWKVAEFYQVPNHNVTKQPLSGEDLTKWVAFNNLGGKAFSPTFYNNSKPQYPRWIFGKIFDETKPYSINSARRLAVADKNRTLIKPEELKRP